MAWTDPLSANVRAARRLGVLLLSGLGDTSARQLLHRARHRAWLAAVGAAIWVLPLPFGPALPGDTRGAIYWSWMHQAGAVGALTCAVGAWWWARAIGQRLTDRAWRRFHQRRAARVWAQPSQLRAVCVTDATV